MSAPAAPLSPLPVVLTRPPVRAVVHLAWPVLGEQLLTVAVGLTDTYLAGQINANASAAVGAAGFFGWLVGNLFGMVSIGATALVSRAIGAGQVEQANRAASQAVRLAGVWGAAIAAGFLVGLPWLQAVVDLQADALELARTLVGLAAAGFVPAAMMFAASACLRGAGDTRSPLQAMILVNLTNIAFSWLLTFGALGWSGLGTIGITLGTVLAWAVGAVLMLGRLRSNRTPLRPVLLGGWHADTCRRLLRVGAPAAADGVLLWIGQAIFISFVTRIPGSNPTLTYAAHMIAVRIESLSYLPAMAFGASAATLVGQGLGAGHPELARRLGLVAAGIASAIGVGMGLLFFFAAEPLMRLFSNDPAVQQLGASPLRLVSFAQLHLVWICVFASALRGAGYTRVPVLITLLSMFAVRLPGSWVMIFWAHWGLVGAWAAMVADLLLRGTLLAQRFWSGAWTRTRV